MNYSMNFIEDDITASTPISHRLPAVRHEVIREFNPEQPTVNTPRVRLRAISHTQGQIMPSPNSHRRPLQEEEATHPPMTNRDIEPRIYGAWRDGRNSSQNYQTQIFEDVDQLVVNSSHSHYENQRFQPIDSEIMEINYQEEEIMSEYIERREEIMEAIRVQVVDVSDSLYSEENSMDYVIDDAELSAEIRQSYEPKMPLVKEYMDRSLEHLRFQRHKLLPDLRNIIYTLASLQQRKEETEEKQRKYLQKFTRDLGTGPSQSGPGSSECYFGEELKARCDIYNSELNCWINVGRSKGAEMRALQAAIDLKSSLNS